MESKKENRSFSNGIKRKKKTIYDAEEKEKLFGGRRGIIRETEKKEVGGGIT